MSRLATVKVIIKINKKKHHSEGDRPLHLAAGAGNLAVLRLLLEVGAKKSIFRNIYFF